MERTDIKYLGSSIFDRVQQRKEGTNQKGFTLIEVLIGIILLSIGLLAIGGMQVTSIRGNLTSHTLTQASYAAQERLEFLSHVAFDDGMLNAGVYNDGNTKKGETTYNRSYRVAINGGLKTIVYTVTWLDGVNRQISFSTIRAQ